MLDRQVAVRQDVFRGLFEQRRRPGKADDRGDGLTGAVRHVASRLRMKCTRHRCQVVPVSTVPIACFRPSWASETTRRTPVSLIPTLYITATDWSVRGRIALNRLRDRRLASEP